MKGYVAVGTHCRGSTTLQQGELLLAPKVDEPFCALSTVMLFTLELFKFIGTSIRFVLLMRLCRWMTVVMLWAPLLVTTFDELDNDF